MEIPKLTVEEQGSIVKVETANEVSQEIVEVNGIVGIEPEGEQIANSQQLVPIKVEKVEQRILPTIPVVKERKKLNVRYQMVAERAARGWTPEQIAQDVKLSRDRVYNILKRDDVWEEVKWIIRDTFSEGDRMIASLYKRSLVTLDDDLNSKDADVRASARADVLKLTREKFLQLEEGEDKPRNVSIIQQIFTSGSEGGGAPRRNIIQNMDDVIMQKRRERGLPEVPEDGNENQEENQ